MININDVYAYLSEKEPDTANSICYASELLLSKIDEAIEALKKRRLNAASNDDDDEYERLTNYRDKLKEYKKDINKYLNYTKRSSIDESNDNISQYGIGVESDSNITQNEMYRSYYEPQQDEIITKLNYNNEEKIGEHVKRCMRELEKVKHQFSHNELLALLNKQKSKEIFGIPFPFFIVDRDDKNVPTRRYWKDPFIFNGQKYYITNHWYEHNHEKFDKWYKGINKMRGR